MVSAASACLGPFATKGRHPCHLICGPEHYSSCNIGVETPQLHAAGVQGADMICYDRTAQQTLYMSMYVPCLMRSRLLAACRSPCSRDDADAATAASSVVKAAARVSERHCGCGASHQGAAYSAHGTSCRGVAEGVGVQRQATTARPTASAPALTVDVTNAPGLMLKVRKF